MKSILALLVLVGIFRAGESATNGWSKPTIGTAEGSGTLTAKINDGVTTGVATGVTITATVAAGGGDITYAKVSQDPTSPVLDVASADGVVTVSSGTVSYSSVTSFTLVVTATEGGTPNTATVTLSVNAAPSFLSHSSTPCIRDGAITGIDLIDLRATDANTGTTITYAIEAAGNTNSDFEITTIPGVVQVAATKTLDITTTSTYTLVITATDDSSTPLIATTTVTATVATTCPSACSGAAALAVTFMTVLSALIISLQ